MTTLSVLVPSHAYGLKSTVNDNVHYIDEQTIVYPAGANVVIYSLESRSQRFLPCTTGFVGVTCLAMSVNKKYLAVAEAGSEGIVTVYDTLNFKKRKVLTAPDGMAAELTHIEFSPDGKLLLAQGCGPDWRSALWVWEKAKVVSVFATSNSAAAPVHQGQFNPSDPTVFTFCGDGIFKSFRIQENGVKVIPNGLSKRENQNYKCHAWLPEDRLVVGTAGGDVIILEGGEVKGAIEGLPDDLAVECIDSYSKGFVVAGAGGLLALIERSEAEKEGFRRTKIFNIRDNPVRIISIAVSPSEESLVCSLETNQLFSFNLGNADIMKPDENCFDAVAQPFHSGGVTGLDTCIRKPLIVTCSVDRSVRVWNFRDQTIEAMKFFPEDPLSVAFHPSGLQILVGFEDKLRLMNILMDDIRTYKEFNIKSCRECRFSHGGHYFAAVNSNVIQIFNAWTCENVGNLRGHNGKVRSLYWSADDSTLISAGGDGAIYEWRLSDFKREKENVLKGCSYTSVLESPDGKHIIAVGSDKKLKEFDDSATGLAREIETGVLISQLIIPENGKHLFAGTETGVIRAYKFPLSGEFVEYQTHSGYCTRMRLSYDDTTLFSVSSDGSIYAFDVRDNVGRMKVLDSVGAGDAQWSFEEVLVTRSDLEERKIRIQELDTQVNELMMQNEYQLRLKDLNMNEKIKEITEKFQSEIESDRARFDLTVQEKNEMEMEYEEKLKASRDRHQQQMQQLEAQYQAKIMAEVERYQQLQHEKELLNERWDEQNSLLVMSHERVIQELTEVYENKLGDEQASYSLQEQAKEELAREFEETKRQLEEDADREIESLKDKYEGRLTTEREVNLRMKGENGMMKKKFNSLQKEIEDQREEIKLLFDQKKDLYATIGSLERDIIALKKEISERDDTITDKEKRIYELKKKNQELEKFKFVLDYKIKELKKQIEPKELEIISMRDQIREMDRELEQYHRQNANLELQLSDSKLKLEGVTRDVYAQRDKTHFANETIKRFHHDLHQVVQSIQDPKALKEGVKLLYQQHITGDIKVHAVDRDVEREYSRQREFLERNNEGLKKKLSKDSSLHRNDNMRIMQENVSLIKEINVLRREIKALKSKGAPMSLGVSQAFSTRLEDDLAAARAENDSLGEEIHTLTLRIAFLEEERRNLETVDGSRPSSRARLPGIDGVVGAL